MQKTETKQEGWRLFLRIFSRLKVIRKRIWGLLILLALQILFSLSEPYFYKLFADRIELAIRGSSRIGTMGSDLWLLAGLFLGVIIGSFLVKFLYRLVLVKSMYRDWKKFLMEISGSFFYLPMSYHVSKNVGEKSKIFDRGANGLFWGGFFFLYDILPQVIIVVLLFMFAFLINVKMALVSYVLLPVGTFILSKTASKLYKLQKGVNTEWDDTFARFSDGMTNIGVIKLFVKEERELEILSEKFERTIESQFKIEYMWSLLMNFLSSMYGVGQVIGIIFGAYLTIDGQMSLGDFFFFIAINSQLYGHIGSAFWAMEAMLTHLTHFGKAEEIIAMEKDADAGKTEKTDFNESIVFDHVSFSYPNTERKILKDVSMILGKGRKIALVGHTGAGKTTVANLITRLYADYGGTIAMDGVDIRDIPLPSYRGMFAQVFQDSTLFNDTIANNLRYVKPSATDEELKDVCRESQILEFIDSLEQGFETIVGERGLKLSGGEKQRLAIARAMLSDPKILILDEATSSLDTETERRIKLALDELMKGRTSLIIAHRLSTIKNADEIHLFDDGSIAASGNHDDLYASSPIYREMIDLQINGYVR